MNRLKAGCLTAGIALALASVSSVQAMSWAQIDSIEDIIKSSAAGFQGTVIKQQYREIDINGSAFPYTETTFHVQDCFYGCPDNNEIVIRQMGGHFSSRKNLAMLVPGLAQYEVDSDYFVFAGGANDDLFGSRFGEHGTLQLVSTEQGGKQLVADHEGILLTLNGKGHRVGKIAAHCHSHDDQQDCDPTGDHGAAHSETDAATAEAFASYVRKLTQDKTEASKTVLDRRDFERVLSTFAAAKKGGSNHE